MKIAIDIREAGGEKTGKGWYTFHIVQNLLKKDTKNEYLLYSRAPIAGFNEFKNAKNKVIPGKSLFWHHKVAKDVQKEGANIFFAPTSFIIPSLLPKSIKSIITVHDLVAFLFPKNHNKKAVILERIFLRKALKKAQKVLTVSENTKNDLIKKFGTSDKKISVVHCAGGQEFKPVPEEKLDKFIKETHLPKKFFLAVGTVLPRKNYLTLLKAFRNLHEKHPNCHLIIVGGKGWNYEEINNYIRTSYLKKSVHMLGYLSTKSLINLYNLANALVFPSLYEGFGIPPLEAMQCGCPVIASNVSSIPEVVGDAALFVDPKSHSQIAEAMERLIKEDDLREDLRGAGLIQSKKFSWEKSAQRLLEIISSMALSK